MNRNYVYAFPSVHGTCNVVNYSGDSTVNSFLMKRAFKHMGIELVFEYPFMEE